MKDLKFIKDDQKKIPKALIMSFVEKNLEVDMT